MIKQLIVFGITNMKDDKICLGGFEQETHKLYRLMDNAFFLHYSFLGLYNESIQTGSIIEVKLCELQPKISSPHVEDTNIDLNSPSIIGNKTREELFEIFSDVSNSSLALLFGYGMELVNGQPVIPEGMGERSIGILKCRKCNSYYDYQGKQRCDIIDFSGAEYRNVPIVARNEVDRPLGVFNDSIAIIGLTRLWLKDSLSEPFYWIIVACILQHSDKFNPSDICQGKEVSW